jgi:Domain of unknown function (DUF4157)
MALSRRSRTTDPGTKSAGAPHRKRRMRSGVASSPQGASAVPLFIGARAAIGRPQQPERLETEANRIADLVVDSAPGGLVSPALTQPPGDTVDLPPVAGQILSSSGHGLDAASRAFMEDRFGRDFSSVRLHTGAEADNAAQALGARAFTFGPNVVSGRPLDSNSREGRHLLAHELAHVAQQGFAPLRGETATGRPALALQPDPTIDDPQAKLDAASMKRWQALYDEIADLTFSLGMAEQVSSTVTRKQFLTELGLLRGRLGEVSEASALGPLEADLARWKARLFDTSAKADEQWGELDERTEKELKRLAESSSSAGVIAFRELSSLHADARKRIGKINNEHRVADDYLTLKSWLDSDTHLWVGELRAARDRVKELEAMLRVVSALRGAGQDDEKLVPGWFDRCAEETNRLTLLAKNSPKRDTRVEFEALEKQLRKRQYETYETRPRKKGVIEKGFDFVKGVLSAVIDPLIEAGKQALDLGQIALHFVSFTYYEPSFVSDTAKAAEKGATTSELLKGMVKGLLETPERLWKAIESGDWEAIGRETANLYLLAKTGKDGAAIAARWIPLIRARAAGLRGGMSGAAAIEVLKIAKREGVVIRFRPTEKAAVKLREAGHPAKPEYLKMKSIKEIDTYLGATKADLGKVGYFKPKLPSNLKSLDTKLQAQIKSRFEARFDEWHSYRDQVKALSDKGLVEHKGNVLVEPSSGKAFTSDYDLFDIRRGTATGESVEFGDLSKSTQRKLKDKPIDAQHGAHLDWKEIPAGQAEGYAKIILEARPGKNAQPLIEFHPDGRIRYTYFVD